MSVFHKIQHRGHEELVFCNDVSTGLKAIIAVHNTALGSALGGCRLYNYATEDQAIDDVLRLSEGMTYKNALADMPIGGAKSVIIADASTIKDRAALFKSFAKYVNELGGKYITAEDVGTSVEDMNIIRENTSYVTGFRGSSGDPSPWTALGVLQGIKAVVNSVLGKNSLENISVAVQGAGHVGSALIKLLVANGAKVTACDLKNSNLESLAGLNVKMVAPDQIYTQEVDVFSPCAMGQTINHETVSRIKAMIICGAANNQLQDSQVYHLLQARGIVYIPDFAVNSGGVISVGSELNPEGWKESLVREKVLNIFNTITNILEVSRNTGEFTEAVALKLAREKLNKHA